MGGRLRFVPDGDAAEGEAGALDGEDHGCELAPVDEGGEDGGAFQRAIAEAQDVGRPGAEGELIALVAVEVLPAVLNAGALVFAVGCLLPRSDVQAAGGVRQIDDQRVEVLGRQGGNDIEEKFAVMEFPAVAVLDGGGRCRVGGGAARIVAICFTVLRFSSLRFAALRFATLRFATLRFAALRFAGPRSDAVSRRRSTGSVSASPGVSLCACCCSSRRRSMWRARGDGGLVPSGRRWRRGRRPTGRAGLGCTRPRRRARMSSGFMRSDLLPRRDRGARGQATPLQQGVGREQAIQARDQLHGVQRAARNDRNLKGIQPERAAVAGLAIGRNPGAPGRWIAVQVPAVIEEQLIANRGSGA